MCVSTNSVNKGAAMKPKDFFARHPVFTHDEFVLALNSLGPRSAKTCEAILAHHTGTGRILRIRRGLYATVPTGLRPDTWQADPFLIAGKLADDAILAYHTALEFHGKAQSVYEVFNYLTKAAVRHLTFRSIQFHGVRFPKVLRDAKKENAFVKKSERQGLYVSVTSLERTLVDVLDRPGLAGGWNEIFRSLGGVEYFNLDHVVEYSDLLANATTSSKVGYYLELRRESLYVEEKHLKPLYERRPKHPHYLDRRNRKAGKFVRKWNLIVPPEIFDRSWEKVQ